MDYLVLDRPDVNRVVEPLDGVAAVAGDERSDVEVALLKRLLRVERGGGALELAKDRAVARHLRAVKARAEPFELVLDLAPPGRECVAERRVEGGELVAELVERAGDGRVRLVEPAGHVGAEVFFDDAGDDRVEPREEVFEPEAVAFERAARAPLDD